jgi:hypothetical protein
VLLCCRETELVQRGAYVVIREGVGEGHPERCAAFPVEDQDGVEAVGIEDAAQGEECGGKGDARGAGRADDETCERGMRRILGRRGPRVELDRAVRHEVEDAVRRELWVAMRAARRHDVDGRALRPRRVGEWSVISARAGEATGRGRPDEGDGAEEALHERSGDRVMLL